MTLLADLDARVGEMLADLEGLVTVESPSDDLAAVRRAVDAVGTLVSLRLGRSPEVVERDGQPHLVWRSGRPRVLLLGHVDTVWPLGTLARKPFSVEDGHATGPGVFDMKAGIVIGLHAVAALGTPPGVALLLTSDEEIGSTASRSLIEETAREVEAVLVLEPAAGAAVKVARKGVSVYTLEVTGRAAHAGLEPENGANALLALSHLALQAAALSRPDRGTTVTPTLARAGTTINTVPAAASLQIDSRAETADEQDRVDADLRRLETRVTGTSVEVRGGINRPPMEQSTTLFERAASVAERLGLGALASARVGGGSDGNFTAALGTPTLDGLGAVGGGAHAEDEHVVVAELPRRATLVAGLIADLLRTGSARP